MTTIPQQTTNETPQFPANPPYDEELAVLLEERDEGAWSNLLHEVDPQFGNPIAAQIAHIMKSRMAGKEVGKLIRKMLTDKAIADRIDDEERWLAATDEEYSADEDPEAEYSADEDPEAEYSDRSLSTVDVEEREAYDAEMAKRAASSQYKERAEAEEDSEEVWSATEGPFRYNMMIDHSLAKR